MKKVFGISFTLVIVAIMLAGCTATGGSTTTTSTAAVTTAASTSTAPATTSAAPTTSTAAKTTTVAATSTTPVTTSTTAATSTAAKTTTTVASSTPATSGNDFTALLGKAAGYTTYSCDVSMITTTGTITSKYWIKVGTPTKFKMESTIAGTTSDTIYDGVHYYMYTPSTNTAIAMSVPTPQPTDAGSATQYNPVYIGSKTVNTYACSGYQYTSSGVLTTMWISTQYGVMVEVVTPTGTIDYSNYNFSALPDSTFQLPAGAIIMTIPGM